MEFLSLWRNLNATPIPTSLSSSFCVSKDLYKFIVQILFLNLFFRSTVEDRNGQYDGVGDDTVENILNLSVQQLSILCHVRVVRTWIVTCMRIFSMSIFHKISQMAVERKV